ncbi:hypothetical protein IAR55_007006 [Kwoniella newhampshirensis]|uniref:SWIM-type domain-containing protein n=1 Tax=Kwoniella newhampshirensis TaxID=1651941 RepID=A0AAW0YDB4_9TREE
MAPSDEFLLLAATLLDALPPSLPISDTLLLQLHAIFGPMLMSALQLVDKREVVRVTLPSDRHVFQVSSSTGKNYTLYIDPPSPSQPSFPVPPPTQLIKTDPDPTASPRGTPPTGPAVAIDNPFALGEIHADNDDGNPFVSAVHGNDQNEKKTENEKQTENDERRAEERSRRERIVGLSKELGRMYCPCAGFAYNSLAAERTVVCKHLLAVIIASKTGREVRASVGIHGVAGLLGLGG